MLCIVGPGPVTVQFCTAPYASPKESRTNPRFPQFLPTAIFLVENSYHPHFHLIPTLPGAAAPPPCQPGLPPRTLLPGAAAPDPARGESFPPDPPTSGARFRRVAPKPSARKSRRHGGHVSPDRAAGLGRACAPHMTRPRAGREAPGTGPRYMGCRGFNPLPGGVGGSAPHTILPYCAAAASPPGRGPRISTLTISILAWSWMVVR